MSLLAPWRSQNQSASRVLRSLEARSLSLNICNMADKAEKIEKHNKIRKIKSMPQSKDGRMRSQHKPANQILKNSQTIWFEPPLARYRHSTLVWSYLAWRFNPHWFCLLAARQWQGVIQEWSKYLSGQFDAGPFDLTEFWMLLRFGHEFRIKQRNFSLIATWLQGNCN